MKKIIWLTLIIFLISKFYNIPPLQADETEIKKSFQVKKGQLFQLQADFGTVDVTSWNSEELEVVVTKYTDRYHGRDAEDLFSHYEVNFEQDSRGVFVRAEYRGPNGWFGSHHGLRVHFKIKVPKVFNLDINTAGGSINVADIDGHIDLHTSGGSIDIGRVGGTVNAKTSGGSIRVQEAKGTVDVNTSGGFIDIGEVSGSVKAETSGGSITVDGAGGDTDVHSSGGSLNLRRVNGNVSGSTSGGSIYAEIIGKIDSDCTLKTSGGSITIHLPRETSANIDAHTSGGHVNTDFAVTVRGTFKSNTLVGKINNGGPLIFLRTSGGSINIKEL